MALDSMLVYDFHGQVVTSVKMILFLGLIVVLLCMMIIKKDILVFGEGQTPGLDDTAIIAEAKYLLC